MKTLVEKLVEVSGEIGFMSFDAKNDFHKYGYVSAGAMIYKVNQALASRGVLLHASDETAEVIAITDKDGSTKGFHATSRIVLCACDGKDTITSVGVGSGSDKGDKAVMKASTAAYKYALAHLFTIGWGAEDPEADTSTDKAASSAKKPPAARAKPKAASKTPDTMDLTTKIEEAKSQEDLEAIKAEILATRGTDDYQGLVKAYQDKKKEIA